MEKDTKKISILLLIALIGFPQISETIYTPALPNIAHSLQVSVYMVESTLAIYFLGFAMGVLLWGIISDRIGRRSTMLIGLMIYAIATLGCAMTESIETLLAWRFLQAFGASVGSVITQTILRDSYEGTERTKVFSIMSGALAFSPAIGPVVGGIISEFLGWRMNFWGLLLSSAVLFIWSFLSLPETRPKSVKSISMKKISDLLLEMSKSIVLWGHVLLIAATNGILFGFYQEAPFIFIDQLHISSSYYGCFGFLIAGATIFAAQVSYKYSHRLTANLMIQWGAGCILMGAFIFTLIVMSGVFNISSIGLILTLGALFLTFFGVGLIIPNSLSQALKPYQIAAGTAGSIFGGFYYCLIAGCTWLMSLAHNGTALPLPLYITMLGLLIACGSQMVSPSYVIQKN